MTSTATTTTHTDNASNPRTSPERELSPNTGTTPYPSGASPNMGSPPIVGASSNSGISPNSELSPKSEVSPESEVSTLKSEASPESEVSTPKSEASPESEVSTLKSEVSPTLGISSNTAGSPNTRAVMNPGISSNPRTSQNTGATANRNEVTPETGTTASRVTTQKAETAMKTGSAPKTTGTGLNVRTSLKTEATPITRNYPSLAGTPVVRNYQSTETTSITQHHQNSETPQTRKNDRSTETAPVKQNRPNTSTPSTTQNMNTTPILQNYRNTETTPLLQNHPNRPESTPTLQNSSETAPILQNSSETAPILQNHPESDPDHPTPDASSPDLFASHPSLAADVNSHRGKKSMALLTFITFLAACAGKIHSPLVTQYVYQVYTESVYGNESQGVLISRHPCLNGSSAAKGGGGGVSSSSSSGPTTPAGSGDDPRNQEVQDKSAELLMQLDMVSGGISILVNLLLGSYSDHLGRRFLLLVPILGHFVRNATAPVIIYWGLGLPALYVGYVVDGLCGGPSGILLGLYVYAADITKSDQQRTLGMAIVETCLGLTTAMSSLGAGYFIEYTGFFYPSLAASLILLVSIFVIIFWLPETVARDRKRCFSPLKGVKRVLSVFLSRGDARKGTLLRLALLAFFLGVFPSFSDSKLRTLYVMDPPFCWSSIQIGIFLSVKDGGSRIVSLVFIQLLRACVLTPVLAMMGAASFMASDILMALSWNDLMVYLVAVVGMGGSMMCPSLRSMMSRMVAPDQQGALFAGIGVVESVCYCLSQFCFLSLYRDTAQVLQGLVYLVIAGFYFLVILCLIIYLCLMRTAVNDVEEKIINAQEEEPSES